MAEDRNKSFTTFLKEKGVGGIKLVALDYATNDAFTTIDALADVYNLSPVTISKIIRYAIENCVITYQMCIRIKEKAHLNQVRHITKGNRRHTPSDSYYDELLENRKANLCKMRDGKVVDVYKFYIYNPTLSAVVIASSFGLSVQELSILLRNAIIFGAASDSEVNEIIEVALSKKHSIAEKERAKKTFEEYLVHRRNYAAIQAKIREVEFHIDSFDTFHVEEADGQTKEELEAQIKALQEKADKYYDILL